MSMRADRIAQKRRSGAREFLRRTSMHRISVIKTLRHYRKLTVV